MIFNVTSWESLPDTPTLPRLFILPQIVVFGEVEVRHGDTERQTGHDGAGLALDRPHVAPGEAQRALVVQQGVVCDGVPGPGNTRQVRRQCQHKLKREYFR